MSNPKKPINFVGARLACLPVAPLVHEALKFLAVPGVAKIFHIIREFTLGGGEPLDVPRQS